MGFTSVKRRKVHVDVADQIENAIISGELREGDNLPTEHELMKSFGVGRPAIREALLLLERSGFLRLSSGGRARVTRPTVSVLVEQLSGSVKHLLSSEEGERSFQDARRVFESAIARNAAETATREEIGRLGEALERNRASLGNMAAFEQTDVEFHLAVAEIGGNPVFGALHRGISEWLSLQRHFALRVAGADEAAFASHEKIYVAISAHEPDTAWQAMNAHLRQVSAQFHTGKVKGALKGRISE